MTGTRSLLIPVTLALVAFAGCKSTPEEPVVDPGTRSEPVPPSVAGPGEVPEEALLDKNRIVARVNGQVITVRSVLLSVGDALRQIDPEETEAIRRILDRGAREIIIGRLEEEEAERLGIKVSKADVERVAKSTDRTLRKRGTSLEEDLLARGIPRWEWEEEQRRRIQQGRFMSVALGFAGDLSARPELRARADAYVSPDEVRARYDRNREDFQVPETARVSAIFVRDYEFEVEGGTPDEARERSKALATSIVSRARRGESFEGLMAKYQKEPVKGFEEPFVRGGHQPYVEEFAWRAKPGDISDLIPTRSGFLVLKLTDSRKERVLPFSEVRGQLEEELATIKQSAAVLKIRGALLNEAVITPKRYKNQLRLMYEEETAKVLEELAK